MKRRLEKAKQMRAQGEPTVPGTIEEELLTNPFMRVEEDDVLAHAKTKDPIEAMRGCPTSLFLFNFVVDDILEVALRESSGLGVELLPGARLTGLEYADDIVLLSPSAEDIQTMLNKVSDRAGLYGMRFAPPKCKVLLQDWGISTPTFFIAGNPLETVDSFTYLGSTISSACNIADEISARIAKARVAFSKLRHLWRRKDVRLSLKGRVYNACVRSILLYGSETWPVRKQDINRLAVFDHRCLRHLAHIKWADRVSNAAVRRRVFQNVRDARSIGQVVTLHSLRWLGHVRRMPAERLPYRTLYTKATNSWVKPRGGQATTWSRNMKTLTAPLSKVGRHRLPGWGPRDHSNRWLETLFEMAVCRGQWRACSVKSSCRRKTFTTLFIVSAYAPADFSDTGVKDTFHSDLAALLWSTRDFDIVVLIGDMNTQAIREGGIVIHDTGVHGLNGRWILEKSLYLIEARRNIPLGSSHNESRRAVPRKLSRSLNTNRQVWLTEKLNEMGTAFTLGDTTILFKLIRATSSRGSSVVEIVSDADDTQPHYVRKTCYLVHWSVDLEPPIETRVRNCISALKRNRDTDPDDLVPALFKEGNEALVEVLTQLFQRVWTTETIPPIFKKVIRGSCENDKGIGLTPAISRVLASIILRRLTAVREDAVRARSEQKGEDWIPVANTTKNEENARQLYINPHPVCLYFSGTPLWRRQF
ncbi:uncharacterized protein DEA37_0011257 [Paragonimus westermani]|uniref:Reverse transcriptase domain-containing protein n=1 Tax=Paragonimus westermani TaxID=34504 RepID=A0A5J4NCT1_9TREM|nr:uncharacterized protein DEA37_0011257 [Paragonimus westermani]